MLFDAAPAEVYEAYVKPELHERFTGSPAAGAPKVGGSFTSWDGYVSGKYVELARGKRIVHEWVTTEWPEGYPPSLVELTVEPNGRKTKLTMVQTRVPAGQVEEYTRGWVDFYWEPMKKYFKKA